MSASAPRVSVIMPCYRHEAYLAQAVESVMAQKTPFEFELLIGDDCSPDGSAELLRSLAARYPERIRLFLRSHNWGPAENYRDLLRNSRGEFLAILEGDDYWVREDKLARQVALMDAQPHLSGCFGWAVKVSQETGEVIGRWGPRDPMPVFSQESMMEFPCFTTCTLLYRREALAGFLATPAELACGDFLLVAEMGKLGPYGFLDEDLAHYRVHQNGFWSSRTDAGRVRNSLSACEYSARSLEGTARRALERHIGVLYYHLCWLLEQEGDRPAARKALAQALRRYPFEEKVGLSHLAGTVIRLYLPIIGRVAGRFGTLAKVRAST